MALSSCGRGHAIGTARLPPAATRRSRWRGRPRHRPHDDSDPDQRPAVPCQAMPRCAGRGEGQPSCGNPPFRLDRHHGFDESLRDRPDDRVTMPAQAAHLSRVQERGQQILMIELVRPMFNQFPKLVHMPTCVVYHASQLWRVHDCGAELVRAQFSP
jgi:hypothetical protein